MVRLQTLVWSLFFFILISPSNNFYLRSVRVVYSLVFCYFSGVSSDFYSPVLSVWYMMFSSLFSVDFSLLFCLFVLLSFFPYHTVQFTSTFKFDLYEFMPKYEIVFSFTTTGIFPVTVWLFLVVKLHSQFTIYPLLHYCNDSHQTFNLFKTIFLLNFPS